MRCSSAALAVFAAVVLALAGSAHGSIVIDSVITGVGPGGGGNRTLRTGFDASGSDKLVVVIGGEHGFPNNVGGQFNSMTYGGTALTQAVHRGTDSPDVIPTAAIFYLDNPGPAGDIVVNQANHNSGPHAIYLLSGTSAGVGAVNRDRDNSVDLTTTAANSLVIAGILNAGPAGGNGAPNMSADSPLTEDTPDLVGGGGRRWVSLSSGNATVGTPGAGTYSFSGANPTDVLAIVAAEFLDAGGPAPQPIPGLFNTGVDDAGNPLPNSAASADTHYSIIVNPDGGGSVPNVQDETVFPINGPWLDNTSVSKWIAPRFNSQFAAGGADEAGNYTYRTTFDLTGLDPSTASISGLWATDNAGLDIFLNGQPTGNPNPAQFGSFTPFTIGAGSPFVFGVNTLDFQLNNSAVGYTGLHVQFTNATAMIIPEPTTLLIWSLLAGLGVGLRWRRRK